MKKYISVIPVLIIVIVGMLLAQNPQKTDFEGSWKKVNELADKQLPESALKEVEEIQTQAETEKNAVQLIKALIYKMRFTLEKDQDKAPELIRELELYADKATDEADKALLKSMAAELYADYYQNNAWTINKRSEIFGYVPEDINEWSKNIYFDKINKLLDASLENKAVLQKTAALKFAELLKEGEDSRQIQPTLFDFLAFRKVNLLTSIADEAKNFGESAENDTMQYSFFEKRIISTFNDLIQFNNETKNVAATIYAELEYLNFLHENVENTISNETYWEKLKKLETKFHTNENVVLVLVDEVNFLLQKEQNGNVKDNFKEQAYAICSDGIKRFPDYAQINVLKNIQQTIIQKTLSINLPELTMPDSKLKISVSVQNIKNLAIDVYRVDAKAVEYYRFKTNSQNNKTAYPKRALVDSYKFKVNELLKFNAVDTVFIINTKDYGIYEVSVYEVGNDGKDAVAKGNFVVSDFGFISRSTKAKEQSLYVLNRKTGLQQSGVRVDVYEPKWNGNGYDYLQITSSKTDKNGFCVLPFTSNYYERKIHLQKGKDVYFFNDNSAFYRDQTHTEKIEMAKLDLFTDRSLYRPGQTVYFKGISYFANKNKQEVNKNVTYDIELFDANNQKVSSKKLKTNDFGSFAGEFVLPDNGLNGQFTIRSGNYSESFWVEEYKRPTFEVKIEKSKNEVRFGEQVTVKGNAKAFAGYNVNNAKVKYRVVRAVNRFCWWCFEPQKEIVTGVTNTDNAGDFWVSFVPVRPTLEREDWRGQFYTYTISADVTDSKGETQQAENYVSVGDKSLFIFANVSDKYEKHEPAKITIYAETLNGERLTSEIDFEVYKLKELPDYIENVEPDSISENKKKVLSGKFNTDKKTLELEIKKWKSGRYKLLLNTKDKWGNTVKTESTFIVYDINDKRPPVKSYIWMVTPKTECEVGEKALIKFGTSTNKTAVLYEVMQGNTILESKWIKFCNNIKSFEVPFKESYGAGIMVQFTFMKGGYLHADQVRITRKIEEKKLTPTLSVFRDKLLPGEKAEWTIIIPESAKEKKSAELMVDMYDASLDAIHQHYWNFYPLFSEAVNWSPRWNSNNMNNVFDNATFTSEYLSVKDYQFDNLNWFGLVIGGRYYGKPIFRMAGRSLSPNTNSDVMFSIVEKSAPMDIEVGDFDEKSVFGQTVPPPPPSPGFAEDVNVKENPVQLRTNFNETAFFYPQLRTDSVGNVKFSFTVPESLTRWNVKMLAHTQDLYFGQNEAQVVTQKDLMVQLNLPRFVRRSDKLVLAANVINLTDKELNADVSLEVINPETEKVIFTKTSPLSLGRGAGGEVVEFEISDFASLDLVVCKVIAKAGNFSDGEQRYLPVLPDKVLVTESMPMTIRGNQTRVFNFESLIKNATKVETQNLSIEFSANPAWYAVQALPTLSTPESNNALDYFAAFYVNSLAGYIANSNPKISKIFQQWKQAGGSREALLSNLQKNTELKNMLLEETPWVMAAKDETEQKKQIALLFDLNMQKNQSRQYLDKLMKLQTPSGGFSWFEEMPENRYVTQEVLLNYARLEKMTKSGLTEIYKTQLALALNYLDLEISKDFSHLKKNNKDYLKENCIGNMQLFYLHVRSEYPDVPVNEKALEAVKYYTAQSEKYWTSFSLYGKAMMALVAKRNENMKVADEILKSLKENALKTDEFGMYWARNRSGYFWNERPIAVQAAIIEAFAEVSKDKKDIEEMKIWLLKQKQTQRWDSPVSTVNAIYALMLQGDNWLENEGKVQIMVGNDEIRPESSEAGTGYFKQSLSTNNITAKTGKVTVKKEDATIGWGAMYWQYYQNLDKIESQGKELKISKKLFVEKIISNKKTMIPIEQTTVNKGDKVLTRLVVTTDRNLEFVALKDLRASCLEPVDQRSGCEWKESVCYYRTTKDASTQFFFSYLPKGTYVFEYESWANNSGEFTSGIASVQCQYAPEFVSHTGGGKFEVK